MTTSEHVRTTPPHVADELTMLRSYLDYHRATLRRKTAGLTREQLATPHPPSDLTLAGLVKHLAYVEDWWCGVNLAGRPPSPPFDDDAVWELSDDWELESATDDAPEELFGLWERLVATSDAEISAAADGVDTIAVRRHPETGEGLSLRWILLHLIEEYARHNGHADLIREAVDGAVGE
ncbi:DinB family protein [Nocardioides sp. 1609]|uniref:DinB family protein n=1 Tax=Nocardioides sp. 1609 TaxID=2508327 RepID=UPI001070154A|nr:DinB family protein [Nocardioides sp. 1609]